MDYLANAELITIDIGANDILPALILRGMDGLSNEEMMELQTLSAAVIGQVLQAQVVPLIVLFNTEFQQALQAVSVGAWT